MKNSIIIMLCLIVITFTACSGAAKSESTSSSVTQVSKTSLPPALTPVPTVPAVTPEPAPKVTAVIEVKDGDTLERDLIPQLMAAFSMTEDEVKQALKGAKSSLIGKTKDFRRMEGIIAPGMYEINGEDIGYWVSRWTEEAEQRYQRISEKISKKNSLSARERVILASVIEGDTNLIDSYENVVAAVFLNRLRRNEGFYSCPTVEYALGYQRPYLKTSDIEIDSKYNTYNHKGLPPAPICCFDDESLSASIAASSDREVYYFFYDYVERKIISFKDYSDFKAAAKKSKARYESEIDPDRFVKMEDKREYFATAG